MRKRPRARGLRTGTLSSCGQAGHPEAELFDRGFLAGTFPADPAREEHDDAVGERQELVELRGDKEYPRAARLGLENLAVDEPGRGEIHASGGMSRHEELGILGDLASYDDLLLVASREGGGDLAEI